MKESERQISWWIPAYLKYFEIAFGRSSRSGHWSAQDWFIHFKHDQFSMMSVQGKRYSNLFRIFATRSKRAPLKNRSSDLGNCVAKRNGFRCPEILTELIVLRCLFAQLNNPISGVPGRPSIFHGKATLASSTASSCHTEKSRAPSPHPNASWHPLHIGGWSSRNDFIKGSTVVTCCDQELERTTHPQILPFSWN